MGEQNQTTSSRFAIEVRSYQLIGATPLTKPVVHNELVFLSDDNVVAAFNGDPYQRGTGMIVEKSLSNKDTLRVRAIIDGTTHGDDIRNKYKEIARGTAFSGSRDQFFEKLGQAVDAAHSINNSNIDYIMLSLGISPQNSNSAVGSMLQAMNLQPPASLASVWAPGSERSLLPADFRSYYTGLSAAKPGWVESIPEIGEELMVSLGDLHEDAVRAKVMLDPDPYAGTCAPNEGVNCDKLKIAGQLFDTQQPSVAPAVPLRSHRPLQMSRGPG